jgi:hypothetical protein
MRISKELIEKYHDGLCTPDEKHAVEEWLFADEAEEELQLSDDQDKVQLREEIWDGIASDIPIAKSKRNAFPLNSYLGQAAAIILLIGTVAVAWFGLKKSSAGNHMIVVNNASDAINKNIQSNDYDISIGPETNVEINNETGSIDFCGAMMINPKEDIEFTLHGTCASQNDSSSKITLKKGQNYIALNYRSSGQADEIIILEEGSLMGLPPIMKRKLMHQFNI